MPDPATRAEYDRLAIENAEVTGYGLDVMQHLACPFYCAPDFIAVRILDIQAEMVRDHTCGSCGRSGRWDELPPDHRHEPDGQIHIGSYGYFITLQRADGSLWRCEWVQTGGDDPPPYLAPMRRV